jgi:hypothetical protein
MYIKFAIYGNCIEDFSDRISEKLQYVGLMSSLVPFCVQRITILSATGKKYPLKIVFKKKQVFLNLGIFKRWSMWQKRFLTVYCLFIN